MEEKVKKEAKAVDAMIYWFVVQVATSYFSSHEVLIFF